MRSIGRRFSLLILAVWFWALPLAAQVAIPLDLRLAVEHVDAMTLDEFEQDNMGSVTIGIVDGADLIWTKSYGHADMEEETPADRNTVYRVGSITKQFTALMLLQLAQGGIVRLSDPVEIYLPEINRVGDRIPDSTPITLVQLATMTSGLAREPDDLPTYLSGSVSEWEQVLIAALGETHYSHEPDTRYLYSNIGYATLGATLGRAAGKPFTDYVHEAILEPLGMAHSAFEPNDAIRPYLSKGYSVSRDGDVDAETPAREHEGRGYKVPNGALYTTVVDLARFVSFELGRGPEEVLPSEVLAENFDRVNSSNGDLDSGYGVGFQLRRRDDLIFHGHGGSVSGYRAAAHMNLPTGIGVIVLRNVGGGPFNVGDLCLDALEVLARARLGSSEEPQ